MFVFSLLWRRHGSSDALAFVIKPWAVLSGLSTQTIPALSQAGMLTLTLTGVLSQGSNG